MKQQNTRNNKQQYNIKKTKTTEKQNLYIYILYIYINIYIYIYIYIQEYIEIFKKYIKV